MLLNCGVREDSWESLGLATSPSYRKSVLNIHWKDWCWSWNSNILATWCEELTFWERPWCWESLKAGGEGDNRGWDGWLASPTYWTWVWINSRSWWWTGWPGILQSMGSQKVGHDWVTELNWTDWLFEYLLSSNLLSIFFSIRLSAFWQWFVMVFKIFYTGTFSQINIEQISSWGSGSFRN